MKKLVKSPPDITAENDDGSVSAVQFKNLLSEVYLKAPRLWLEYDSERNVISLTSNEKTVWEEDDVFIRNTLEAYLAKRVFYAGGEKLWGYRLIGDAFEEDLLKINSHALTKEQRKKAAKSLLNCKNRINEKLSTVFGDEGVTEDVISYKNDRYWLNPRYVKPQM